MIIINLIINIPINFILNKFWAYKKQKNFGNSKKIYNIKIGKEYKIPKLCVIDFIYNINTDKSNILKDYGDILDFKEVRKILRNPCRNTLYKILKNKEIYFLMIANEYKIPKTSLIDYIFKDYC